LYRYFKQNQNVSIKQMPYTTYIDQHGPYAHGFCEEVEEISVN
jgi:hypothetical protein